MTDLPPVMDRVALEERLEAELSFSMRHGTALAILLIVPEELRARTDEAPAFLIAHSVVYETMRKEAKASGEKIGVQLAEEFRVLDLS